jgi:hypothetical protein
MATDIEKGLPIRTEDDLDQKTQVKIVDHVDPNGTDKQTEVSEKLVHVRDHGHDPAGTKVQLRLTEEGRTTSNGDYDASTNTKPSSDAIIAHDRGATIDETKQNQRPTAIGGDSDKIALDVSISDSSGNNITENNPLPVHISEDIGEEFCDYNEADVLSEGSDTHTYSVANGKILLIHQVAVGSSGRSKVLVEIGDGAATEAFTGKRTLFVSESSQDNQGIFAKPLKVIGTANTTTVKLTRTNRDDDDDAGIYTSIIGILKDA